jgi:hypothetical protein
MRAPPESMNHTMGCRPRRAISRRRVTFSSPVWPMLPALHGEVVRGGAHHAAVDLAEAAHHGVGGGRSSPSGPAAGPSACRACPPRRTLHRRRRREALAGRELAALVLPGDLVGPPILRTRSRAASRSFTSSRMFTADSLTCQSSGRALLQKRHQPLARVVGRRGSRQPLAQQRAARRRGRDRPAPRRPRGRGAASLGLFEASLSVICGDRPVELLRPATAFDTRPRLAASIRAHSLAEEHHLEQPSLGHDAREHGHDHHREEPHVDLGRAELGALRRHREVATRPRARGRRPSRARSPAR